MTTINDQGICYHDIMWRITNACNKMDGAYYFCGKKLGIKENTLTIIYALEDGHPHSQKQISEEWLIPKTTINTTVKEMMQEGLITFLPGGKEKAIMLTEQGRQYVRSVLRDINRAEQQALARTLQRYPAEFVDAFEFLSNALCEELAHTVLQQPAE